MNSFHQRYDTIRLFCGACVTISVSENSALQFRSTAHVFRGVVAIALMLCSISCFAQQAPGCKGPAELDRALAVHPSAAVYDALGAYFAKHSQRSCAISSFESAVRLSPDSWEAHYNLGIAFYNEGKTERAISELKAALRLKPATVQVRLALATALSSINRNDEAAEEFNAVLKGDPKSIPALDGLAKILTTSGRYSAATALLRDAPADEVLQVDLAIAYSKNGDLAKAIATLSAIVKAHPDYPQAHTNLGIVYTQQNEYREAAREFEEALRLNTADDEVRSSYVKALVILAQFNTAEPVVAEYLKRKPGDFDALYLSGVVDRGLGKYTDAERLLQHAVKLNPRHSDAHYNLGFVLARLSKPAEARDQFEEALKLNPDASEARFQLAAVLRTLGEQDKAREELNAFQQKKQESVNQDIAGTKANQANQFLESGEVQKAIDLYRASLAADPNNGRTYYDLALALDRQKDYAAEREALQKSTSLDQKFAPAHNQLGFLCLQSGQSAEAEKELKLAVSLDPQYAEAQSNLGVLYAQQGNNSEAERLFRQATENNPQYAQAFVNLGLTLAAESRFEDADQALQNALRIQPANPSALTAHGMVLVRLKKAPEAIAAFRKVIELDPKSEGAHLNLGIALADQFDLVGALAEFTEAVNLNPNSAPAHYNKGRVLVDLRRNIEAKPELEAACRLDPTLADPWYLLGLIAKQNGSPQEAISLFKKNTALDPDNADAHYLLGQELLRIGDANGAIGEWRKSLQIHPDYGEALYNLSRLLSKTDPEEAKRLNAQFQKLQADEHVMDRAQTLGNFGLAAADARNWPQAIDQLKEGLQLCGDCSAKALLHKDLGLIYCRSGDLKNGQTELMEARKLSPNDPDIAQALQMLSAHLN